MHYGFGDVLTLLGSLGLFLYGMKVMSDALMEVAGDRMRKILATMTSNRLFAVFTGFLITAIIQSSSATTLMVVSFANASLLTLTESIGVIMGANIGTTVTAWLITLLGFKVNISAIALPLVGLGFLFTFSKKKKTNQWGRFVIGFAILFIGLQFLKDAVPDIGNNPEALAFLSKYTQLGIWSVLLFLLIGSILTIIVQSSSATMALTLVMCYEGWIPFDMAAAMVLGENIGTTVTANLAALIANYHAKRTARAHLIFNLLGVVWMLILFVPFLNMVNWFVTRNGGVSPFVEATAIPVALSVFHTTFNIANTFFLIWFVPVIANIVKRLVPEKVDPEREIDQPIFLNKSYLKYPQTGVAALLKESKRLFEEAAYKAIAHGINIHRDDIASDKKTKVLVDSRQVIEVDLDGLYYTKIKSIYSKIVEYATVLQSRFELNKDLIATIRTILVANRLIVAIVKSMKPIHKNMSKYVASDNYYIKKEYNDLRKIIIKVLRVIIAIRNSDDPSAHLSKLEKLRDKADKSDVIMDGTLNRLIRDNHITNEMATSLMNDSAAVTNIVKNLIAVAELLYIKKDPIFQESKTPELLELEEGILSDENGQM
ncbi:Na/Pi cotransporter family protein [Flagellimonas lutaonensis]|uniref:Putative transmembrane Na+/Pi-cotransporter n=1 Tax=Flagellimonas lutaonensis TaxID=516051 RepID=A0A0D5YV00_9FLAO|nr:Na/Pi cotransporter family protein [Allomuricauda lutaonensis]AKA35729.1 Putative transmembrane Na+/Pi-cotransporter [Allomuricauda lutaonensis]